MEQQQTQMPEMSRPLVMDQDSAEIKKYEIDPEEELQKLKVLLYGVVKTVKKDNEDIPVTDDKGQYIYLKPPIVNSDGAEEIYNYAYQHTNKIISLGFYDDKLEMNTRIYESMKSFAQSIFINYLNWQLDFHNSVPLFENIYALIYSSYSRGLRGNEKLYRAKTQTSHDQNVKHEVIQMPETQNKPNIVRRLARKLR